jgi:parallel beta-helix repeat protein
MTTNFGIDSKMVFDTGGKSVATRLTEIETEIATKITKGAISYNVQDYGATGLGSNADTAAIQAVLDIAKTKGAVHCIIPDGTYWITNRLYLSANTKVIMGKNTRLLRKWAGGFFINVTATDTISGYNGKGNILIDGGILDGNWADYGNTYKDSGGNTQTKVPAPTYYGFDGIGLVRGDGIIIRNVTFLDSVGAHSMDINACKNMIIENCKFKGYCTDFSAWGDNLSNFREAIQISNHTLLGFSMGGVYDGLPCENIYVKRCYFGPSDNLPALPSGVGNHGAVRDKFNTNIVVEDCVFDGCIYAGVRPFSFVDMVITKNRFISCEKDIRIDGASAGSESSKYGDGTQSNLPQTGKNYIITNNFSHNSKFAIQVNGIPYKDGSNVVTLARVENIIIRNNIFDNSATPTANTIGLYWSKGAIIEGNTFKNAYRGIWLETCVDTLVSGNYLDTSANNFLYFAETTGWTALGYSTGLFVNRNTVMTTNIAAINLTAIDGFRLSDNYFKGCGVNTAVFNEQASVNMSASVKNGVVANNMVYLGTVNQPKYGMQATASCTNIQFSNNYLEGVTTKLLLPAGVASVWDGEYTYSPNGTRYKITVSDTGVMAITAG